MQFIRGSGSLGKREGLKSRPIPSNSAWRLGYNVFVRNLVVIPSVQHKKYNMQGAHFGLGVAAAPNCPVIR